MSKDNPNVINIQNMSEEDREMVLPVRMVYANQGTTCPMCGGSSIEEETFGYEKVSFCTHCEYSASKTL